MAEQRRDPRKRATIRVAPAVVTAFVVVGTVLTGDGGAFGGEGFANPHGERFFRVESSVSRSKNGKGVLSGYVYNTRGSYAAHVELMVEQVDTSGLARARTYGFVPGDVPAFGRAYFELPVASATGHYRARVVALEWVESPSGRWR